MFPTRRITLGGDKFRDEYSLAFDGTDDHINIGNVSTFNNLSTFSIVCWVYVDSYTGTAKQTIFSKDNVIELILTTSGTPNMVLYVDNEGAGDEFGQSITAGEWTHVVATFTGGSPNDTRKLYLNGSLVSTITSGGKENTETSENDAVIGGRASSNYMNGKVSELAFYNNALSNSQVKTIYNGREPYNHKEGVASSNLVGWWRMGDGALDKLVNVAGVIGGTGLIGDATNETLASNTTPSWSDAGAAGTASVSGQEITFPQSGVSQVNCTNDAPTGNVKVNVTVSNYTGSGNISLPWNGAGSSNLLVAANGTYEYYEDAGNDDDWSIYTPNGVGATVTINSMQTVNGNAGVMFNMSADNFKGDTP